MRETRNDCVGCDCRRCDGCPYLEVEYLICDECGAEFNTSESLYEYNGDELCEACYLDKFQCVTFEDFPMEFEEDVLGYCDECGSQAEELYNVDGEWLCRSCALKKGEI